MNAAGLSATRLNTFLATDPTARSQTPPAASQLEVREKFQDFVAGTFFKQMLKALRSTQDQPAYLHGGQAEQVFQAQMDEQIAEQLAREHGGAIAGPLFNVFSHAAPPPRFVPGWDNRAQQSATSTEPPPFSRHSPSRAPSHSPYTAHIEEQPHALSVTV